MARKPDPKDPEGRPRIWVDGSQRPPFQIGAFARASLFLSREGIAPLHAWAARSLRQSAQGVRDGKGRIPAARLGRAAPYVPSHLRVAMWIRNLAATFAHASATADPDFKRGNALVAEIEAPLWPLDPPDLRNAPPALATVEPAPVVLTEPGAPQPADPLAAIRRDMSGSGPEKAKALPKGPPGPPGQVASTAIQVLGWVCGWATSVLALPFGLVRAGLAFAGGQDLRKIGREE